MDALDHKLSSEISEIKKMLIALHRQMENQRICESQPPLAKVRLYCAFYCLLLRTLLWTSLAYYIAHCNHFITHSAHNIVYLIAHSIVYFANFAHFAHFVNIANFANNAHFAHSTHSIV